MAEPRSRKLKRLVAVQRQLERMAELELAETSRERARLAQSLTDVVDALESMAPEHRVFSHLYANRVATLTVRDGRLAGLENVQEAKLLSERIKADRLQEAAQGARAAEEREAEEESLYDLIDRIGSGSGSSLP